MVGIGDNKPAVAAAMEVDVDAIAERLGNMALPSQAEVRRVIPVENGGQPAEENASRILDPLPCKVTAPRKRPAPYRVPPARDARKCKRVLMFEDHALPLKGNPSGTPSSD